MRFWHCLSCLFLATSSALAATNGAPKFEEVYKLLRENLRGVSPERLDESAVKGLVKQLEPHVSLSGVPGSGGQKAPLVRSQVFEGSFEYFQIGQVSGDLAAQIESSYRQTTGTNRVKGIILDLRFADGTDYAAAGAVANLFVSTEQPLLDWGTGAVRSTQKTNAIAVPVAILVNKETKAAAEGLAAVLREVRAGLVIGATTAGQASEFKEFTLTDGSKLRIATSPVKLAEGKAIGEGVMPDISVSVSSEDELAYMKDPYATLRSQPAGGSETNQVDGAQSSRTRRRMNEAELVRQQREGADLEGEASAVSRRNEVTRPLVADPALARALDLLKGLTVVQQGAAELKAH